MFPVVGSEIAFPLEEDDRKRSMVELSDENLNVVFREARTFSAWTNQPVADEILRKIYEPAKLGPTSANSGPPTERRISTGHKRFSGRARIKGT